MSATNVQLACDGRDSFNDLLVPTLADKYRDILPEEMKLTGRFLVFKLEDIPGSKKKNKIPHHPDGYKCNDPTKGVSFEEALAVIDKFDGLGWYVEPPYTVIDNDNCIDPETGDVTPEAAAIVREFNSYSDSSVSGTGIHTYMRATKPGSRCRQGLEIYSTKRFMALGTVQIPETPREIRDCNSQLKSLYERTFHDEVKTTDGDQTVARKEAVQIQSTGTAITTKLQLLLTGTIVSTRPFVIQDEHGNKIGDYPSHSEADLALCTLLALEGKSGEEIDAAFRESSLYREKWERQDYRRRTIAEGTKSAEKLKNASVPPINDVDAQRILEGKWADPQPLEYRLPPVKPFDENSLPESLRSLVADTADRMSVPMDFPAIIAITALAGAVGRRAFVYPKAKDKTWTESLNLWGAIVERPGKLKSPVMNVVCRPVNDLESDWAQTFRNAWREFMERKEEHKKWDKRERKRKAPDPQDPEKSVGDPPVQRRLVVNDTTPEKLHDIVADNPQGVLVLRDEMSGWLDELDQEGRESQRTLFLTAWNGNSEFTVDRIGRGTRNAVMCVSMIGTFQPGLLQNYLEKKDRGDGLFQRFQLLIWPDTREWKYVDREANSAALAKAHKVYKALSNLPAEALKFHFDPEAQKLFEAWIDELMAKVDSETAEDKQSHLSKYRSLMPTLSALFQLADLAATSGEDCLLLGGRLIDVEHTRQAIAFCSYLESHLDRVYGAIRPIFIRIAMSILDLIKTKKLKSGFTIRDIQRGCRANRHSDDDVRSACDELESLGWLREFPYKPEGPGRPTKKYQIHPDAINFMGRQ